MASRLDLLPGPALLLLLLELFLGLDVSQHVEVLQQLFVVYGAPTIQPILGEGHFARNKRRLPALPIDG